jgi:hypothetical protein
MINIHTYFQYILGFPLKRENHNSILRITLDKNFNLLIKTFLFVSEKKDKKFLCPNRTQKILPPLYIHVTLFSFEAISFSYLLIRPLKN